MSKRNKFAPLPTSGAMLFWLHSSSVHFLCYRKQHCNWGGGNGLLICDSKHFCQGECVSTGFVRGCSSKVKLFPLLVGAKTNTSLPNRYTFTVVFWDLHSIEYYVTFEASLMAFAFKHILNLAASHISLTVLSQGIFVVTLIGWSRVTCFWVAKIGGNQVWKVLCLAGNFSKSLNNSWFTVLIGHVLSFDLLPLYKVCMQTTVFKR